MMTMQQKLSSGHSVACLLDGWTETKLNKKTFSVGFNVLTLLPIIGLLSVGVSIMSLIVIILLLTSLLLHHITDWDDKRVVSSNIFRSKWIRICKISNEDFEISNNSELNKNKTQQVY